MRESRPNAFLTAALGILAAVAVSGCGSSRDPSITETGMRGSATCSACHGDDTSSAPPRSTTGATATTDIGVGAHRAHLTDGATRKAIACSECHEIPQAIDAPGHLNKVVEVRFGPLALAKGAAANWNRSNATCSNVYCHGAPARGGAASTPVWTRVDGTQARCESCHGTPPATDGHVGVPSDLSACASCHAGTVRRDGSILVSGELHVNGTVESSWGHDAGWTVAASPNHHAYAANKGLSACQECHGWALDGLGGTASTSCASCHDKQGVSWKTNCTMCHGDATQAASPSHPFYAAPSSPAEHVWGMEAETVRSGAHRSHLAATHDIANPIDCGDCHRVPEDALSPGHIDGPVAQVEFSSFVTASDKLSPAWDRGAATCASTYCHGATLPGGTSTTPVWTATSGAAIACNGCHGSPPATSSHAAGGTACATCHGAGYSASGISGAALDTHVDGRVTVPAHLACNTCHGSSANDAPPRSTRGETATTSVAVGAHQAHVAVSASPLRARVLACSDCHGTLPATTPHSNGRVDMIWGQLARARGGVPTWDRTTATCANYCHGSTLAAGGTITSPSWTSVNGSAKRCNACHGAPPPSHLSTSTNCASCHGAGYADTGITGAALGTHIDGNLDVGSLTCTSCHGTSSAPAAIAAAPPSGTKGETAATTRAVGAHQAHLQGTHLRALAIACDECHAIPTATDHANGIVNLAWGWLATRGGQVAPAWNTANLTCTSYCHGSGLKYPGGLHLAPSWTAGTAQAACNSCHGNPPGGAHTASTECGNCHAGFTRTSVDKTVHMNGYVDWAFNCTSCHGSSTAPVAIAAAPPGGVLGETAPSTRAVGAHQAHLVGTTLRAAPIACGECHSSPAAMDHGNNVVEMAWGPLAQRNGQVTPAWNATNLTCTNYCHGSGLKFTGGTNLAPTWTSGSTQVACGTCHGVPPVGAHTTSTACGNCHPGYSSTTVNQASHINGAIDVTLTCTSCHGSASAPAAIAAAPPTGTRFETAPSTRAVGAHQAHLTGTSLRAAPIACAECHATPATMNHGNGTVELAWGSLARHGGPVTPTWNTSSLTCTNYCHGTGLASPGATQLAPVWTSGASQVACNSCHGNPPGGTHTASAACGNCHAGYTSSTVNKASHINGTVDTTFTCTSCHGSATAPAAIAAAPPAGVHGETAASTRAVGAHQAHLTGTTLRAASIACVECHATPTTMNHGDGAVDMTWGPLAKHDGAVTPAWNVANLTCANYCHGTGLKFVGGTNLAPTWTSGATQVTCSSCHGNPPGGTHSTSTSCGDCHGGYTSTSVDKAAHINGVVDVTYSCTTCHGSASAPAAISAAPPSGTRGETAATTRAVGAHQAHLTGTRLRATAIACADCHVVPTSTTHSNGTIDWNWSRLATHTNTVVPAWSGTSLTCTNYCHGSGLKFTGGVHLAPSWTAGSAQAACNSCHGNPPGGLHPVGTNCSTCHPGYTSSAVDKATHINGSVEVSLSCTSCHGTATAPAAIAAAPPAGTRGETATSTRAVGAHQAHLTGTRLRAGAIACSECHSGPASMNHANGVVEMTWGALATRSNAVVAAWNGTSLTCTNYCHGAGLKFTGGVHLAPSWTAGSAQAACNSCHGNPPGGLHPVGTNCSACHPGYTSSAVDKATHINGSVEVSLSCTSCHGTATAPAAIAAAPPAGTRGETATSTRAVGAHQAHLTGASLRASAVACGECHANPSTMNHVSGTVEMTWGTLATSNAVVPTWSAANLSCTNYCHGTGLKFTGGTNRTPVWTSGAGQVTCGTCHGIPPGGTHSTDRACGKCHAGYTSTTVDRTVHINGAVEAYLSCTSCHGDPSASLAVAPAPPTGTRGETATTTRAVGAHQAHLTGLTLRDPPISCGECHSDPVKPNHVNGAVEMAWGSLATHNGAVAPTWNTAALTCTNYCHGTGLTFTGGSNRLPTWTTGSSQAACGTCHGLPPGGLHPVSTVCESCHVGYTVNTVNKQVHVNGVVDESSWCSGCHGTASTITYAGAAPATGAHQAHVTGITLRNPPIACSECHTVPTTTAHVNGVVEMAWGALATRFETNSAVWDGVTQTCSNYCHGSGLKFAGGTNLAPGWLSGPSQAACGTCHGIPPGGTHTTSLACGSCHAGYSITTVNKAIHMNGFVEMYGNTCTSCHGSAAAPEAIAAAPPTGTLGETAATTRAVGAHQAHLTGARLRSKPITCQECHVIPLATTHPDAVVNLAWGPLASRGGLVTPSWNAATLTCTNYCHGSGLAPNGFNTVPSWIGGASQVACGTCHGIPPSSHGPVSGCASCHSGYTPTTINRANHINGQLDW